MLSLNTPSPDPTYNPQNDFPPQIIDATKSPHLSQNRLLILLYNEGIIVNPDKVYLNQYPVDIYVNPTEAEMFLSPSQLHKHRNPDHQEVRVGITETNVDGTIHKQMFFVENSPAGLDLTFIEEYSEAYRVTDTRTIHVTDALTDPDNPVRYVIVPSAGCSCASSLKTLRLFAGAGFSAMERKTINAVANPDETSESAQE